MNKFFTKIAAAFVGMTMAIGVGVAVASGRDVSPADATEQTGTINFGSATGSTNINTSPKTGDDSLGNTWTITTVGTTSYTPNASYAQIGSGNKPATSITFTTTLADSQTITSFSAKFGGFNGTAGTVTLKVGGTTVGTGSLNATSNVTVSNTENETGTVLTVTVTGISKGVKAYYISYGYDDGQGGSTEEETSISLTAGKSTLTSLSDSTTVSAVVKDSSDETIAGADVSWSVSPETGVVSLSETGNTRTVTATGDGKATITATYDGVSEQYAGSSQTIDITVDLPETFPEGTSDSATFTSSATVVVGETEYSGLKLGTSGKGGTATVTIPAYSVAMTFRAAAWNGKTTTLSITGVDNITPSGADSYTPTSDTGISGSGDFELAGSPKKYLHTIYFDKVNTSTTVTFTSASERVVIWDIKYYLDNNKYTVHFDANNDDYSDSVPEDITQSTPNTAITLPSALSCTGYTWLGWNTSDSGGQSTRKDAGSSYNPASNQTLYGEWQINSYTVGGEIKNGSLSSTANVTHGSALNIKINPATNYTYPESIKSVTMGDEPYNGYTYDSSNGNFSIASVTGNVYIEASCVATVEIYTVTYNSNGGSSVASEEIAEGGHPTFPSSSLSGYVFKGWQVNGEGTIYTSENASDYSVEGNVTFVAKWAQLFTVSFNSNGGSESPENQSVEDGSTFTFPSAGTKTNWTFDGWTSTGSAPYYSTGSNSPAVVGSITYTAHWTEKAKYTVSYVAGENAEGSFSHTNQYVGDYTLLEFTELSGITYDSSIYRFKNYTVNNQTKVPGQTFTLDKNTEVTVNFEVKPTETTYDFTTNFSTYASGWTNSYGTHEGLNGKTDLGGEYGATIDMYLTSKQTGTISTMPVIANKKSESDSNYEKALQFTLKEAGYVIESVEITFAQWGTKTPKAKLYAGDSISGTAVDTVTISSTSLTLSADNLNNSKFCISYCGCNSGSNVQLGIKSISVTLKKWSQLFLDTFTCTGVVPQEHPDGDISVANPTTVWSTLASLLDDEYKNTLKILPADEDGTVDEQAMARYDLVVKKYRINQGIEAYSDFIGRFADGGINSNTRISFTSPSVNTQSSTVIFLVVISVVSGMTICGYFLLRRRKENN